MATLILKIKTDKDICIFKTKLILYKSFDWKIAAFFRSIGQKKRGERLVMDWSKVIGSHGRARIKVVTYTAKDGSKHTINDVDRYYDFDPEKMSSFLAAEEFEALPFD